jgi:hypothetical protein
MRILYIIRVLLCAALLLNTFVGFAFETDQYNLPPKPLADIGDEVSQYTEGNIREAVSKLNEEIEFRQKCFDKSIEKNRKKKCSSVEKERVKLEYLRSEEAVAKAVFSKLGAGIPPFTSSEGWMNSHQFTGQPARYKTNYGESIFALNPFNYLTISPTVNLYGNEFGTDKIAHLFQQGFTYYQKYNRGLAAEMTAHKASEKAIRWGQMTERTFYGTLISGVYSNADLCANFAGMKFYQGLTKKIKLGEITRSAILILKNGFWEFNENVNLKQILLKPLISNHFNEALNPSKFVSNFGFRSFVRRSVKKRSCQQWLNSNLNLTKADLENLTKNFKNWYGEDYGFSESENFITIANTCFD